MSTTRSVLGITGIRSEYDILSSVFRAIVDRDGLDLKVVATGAHLSDAYGRTLEMIERDGFEIVDRIESLINGDTKSARTKGMALQLQGLVQTVDRLSPDILLVLGDREEALNAAIIGNYMNIPVAHIAGGDRVVGNADDQVRHAVTKLSHIHFATNLESAQRIVAMGEQEFRVFNVGNPGLDRLMSEPMMSREEALGLVGANIAATEPYIILIQHPLSSEVESSYEQMKTTLDVVEKLGICTVLTYPNSDAGSQAMIKAIGEYRHVKKLWTARNIERTVFVNLLRGASCLIGNSSAGILEAPSLHLPVVNIGNRQMGRLHGENVQFVPHDVEQITKAIRRALEDETYKAKIRRSSNPYGDGKSAARIAGVLADIPLDSRLKIKDMTY